MARLAVEHHLPALGADFTVWAHYFEVALTLASAVGVSFGVLARAQKLSSGQANHERSTCVSRPGRQEGGSSHPDGGARRSGERRCTGTRARGCDGERQSAGRQGADGKAVEAQRPPECAIAAGKLPVAGTGGLLRACERKPVRSGIAVFGCGGAVANAWIANL